jgi:hypothetical protein
MIDKCVFDAIQPYARFYPIRADKSPGIRKPDRNATTDRHQLAAWARRRSHAGFAARIAPGSRLFVLDLEDPYKHRGKIGPSGEMTLGSILEDLAIRLPEAPTTRTCNFGLHIYLLAPGGLALGQQIGIWPGVDLLAGGSNVILPGARVKEGAYKAIRGFDQCAIPDAPVAFVDALQAAKRPKNRYSEPLINFPCSETAKVSDQQRYLLMRDPIFQTMWYCRKRYGDLTKSCYEFHIAKCCLARGLSPDQVVTVVRWWWAKYGLQPKERRLRRCIIPKAWTEVAPYVLKWQSEHPSRGNTNAVSLLPCSEEKPRRGRPLSSSTRRVLNIRTDHPDWTSKEIAETAGITQRSAAMILHRYAE